MSAIINFIMESEHPNIAICVGAAKSGTSWLYKCLEEHPHINAARGKETNFFLQANSSCQDFFEHFEAKKTAKWHLEASPLYFSNRTAARGIYRCFPDAKIIIILREPTSRTLSHMKHMVSIKRYQTDTPLEEAAHITPEIIEDSLYHKHVPTYQNLFTVDNVLLLQYERIATEPQVVLDEVCDFLNLDHFTPKFIRTKYNSSQARSHPWFLPIRSLYIKSRRYAITRQLVATLRRIGFDSGTLEKFLMFHPKKQPPAAVLKNKRPTLLEPATDFYHLTFPS